MNKKQMRSDMKYIRELMRQLKVAMQENNLSEILEISNEMSCASIAIGNAADEAIGEEE